MGPYLGLPSWSLPVYQRKPQKMAAETWAQKNTGAGSANGKKLSAQRLWLVLCLAIMSSTVSADAKGINYTITSMMINLTKIGVLLQKTDCWAEIKKLINL